MKTASEELLAIASDLEIQKHLKPYADTLRSIAAEVDYLYWFRIHSDFGPADSDVKDGMNEAFQKETGKPLPEGWGE